MAVSKGKGKDKESVEWPTQKMARKAKEADAKKKGGKKK